MTSCRYFPLDRVRSMNNISNIRERTGWIDNRLLSGLCNEKVANLATSVSHDQRGVITCIYEQRESMALRIPRATRRTSPWPSFSPGPEWPALLESSPSRLL